MFEGFVLETTKIGIKTDSLVYTDVANNQETENVILWLKRLKVRHVLVLGYEDALEPIMNAAHALNAVGPEFLYVFPCFDVFILQRSLRVKHGKIF